MLFFQKLKKHMVQFIGLRMQGIRSIGDTPLCINFLTPLTIIQGPNGTGKTTIIEALNYVSTGALPAGKMQTFIHNNQIANKTRVDAMVQLIFKDTKGNTCTATKRMNASTVRAGKLTTKSDEFTLKVVDKKGNPKSYSSKVADFNKEMLNLLGVPKAILEYVLFCHQDDINWPLSEPKELKMRFDAIFEVTKFVKALDNVKKNIKELNTQIQMIDKEMPHLENNLRGLTELRMTYDNSVANSKQIKNHVAKYFEEKEKIEKELLATRKQHQKAVEANHVFEVLQGQINTHMRYMEGLMTSTEFTGRTREELLLAIENLKQSDVIREVNNQRELIISEIESIGAKIEKGKKMEEYYRDQIMQYDTRQMIMKNREDEYMKLLKQYSEQYEVPINPQFVEDLRAKITSIETLTATFMKEERKRCDEIVEKIENFRLKSAEYKSQEKTKRQEHNKLSAMILNTQKEVKNVERASQAVIKLAQEIAKLEGQLKTLADFKLLDSIWESLQELQNDLNILRMDMMELGDNAESLEAIKEKTTGILEKANEILNEALGNIGMLKTRVQIQNQLMEFKDRKAAAGEKAVHMEIQNQNLAEKKEQLNEIENSLNISKHELPVMEKELKNLETERRKIMEAMNLKERESSMHINSLNYAITKIDELKMANEREKMNDESSKNEENYHEKMKEQKMEIDQLLERRRQLESQLSGVENKKHQLAMLEAQLRRLSIQEEVDALKHQLDEAKENAMQNGVENIAELKKKEGRLNQRAVEVNNQIHQKNGEQLQLRKKIDELKKQLTEPRYENAQKLLLDKVVEKNIITSAIEDLETYYKVVDDAIINFHQRKMEQINQILRELWMRVYQGNDIETIKIKSQPVGGGATKKSYDYSVVMTVDQTDLDMRDRCSAGQKVLASILIRIALADVFAGNCRILALDEPTTNLDAEKVENIATMLKSLIEMQNLSGGAIGARELCENDFDEESTIGNETTAESSSAVDFTPQKSNNAHQSALQLIVITHDQRLVQHLHLACRPDYIYGLSKNENGVSQIKKYSNISSANLLETA